MSQRQKPTNYLTQAIKTFGRLPQRRLSLQNQAKDRTTIPMMFLIRSKLSLPAVFFLAVAHSCFASPYARAAEVIPLPADRAASAGNAARAWLKTGKNFYNLGEFDKAIAAFKEAYKLEPNSALLLNIAQAYRMAGDCPRALSSYRAFIRNGGDQEAVKLATTHEATLSRQCGPEALAKAATKAKAELPRPVRIGSFVSLGMGATALAVAGGAFLWNQGRVSRWEVEERDLTAAAASGTVISSDLEARQNRNDDLLSAARRTDRVCLALLAGGAVLVSVGIGIRYLSPLKASVNATPTSVALRLAF